MPVRVLVIDDDALSREVFELLLHSAGYVVETAESGDDALDHLSAQLPPEVILTDLQMPGTSGNELAQKLRNLCGPATLLVAMSASEPEDESASSFDTFLLKPFTVDAFTRAITGHTSNPLSASNLDSAAVLDEAVYRKLAGSMRPEQVKQLYAMCLSDAEGRLAKMRQAAATGDADTFKREAHAIKGSSGMVGALQMQTLATSMEKQGFSDNVVSLDEFVAACQRLRRMLVANESINNRVGEVSGEDA